MKKTTNQDNAGATAPAGAVMPKRNIWTRIGLVALCIFFLAEWAMLAIYDHSTLARIEQLSAFYYNSLFFKETMAVPAGFLSYLGSFLIQFFYYPALGAVIYVAGLYLVYRLTVKVFEIPKELTLLALFPVVLLLATNTQLGYWIFYLKMPGYYFMALLAVIFSLSAMLLMKKLSPVLQLIMVMVWIVAGYPLMGVYALVSSLFMALYAATSSIRANKGVLLPAVTLVVAVVLVLLVPRFYYNMYTSVPYEFIYLVGTPCIQWRDVMVAKVEHSVPSYWHSILFYWVPFFLLVAYYAIACVLPLFKGRVRVGKLLSAVVALLAVVLLHGFYWYNDNNFRIENKQNRAMWEQDWRAVADYARDAVVPTRQIVMNKNIALQKMGTLGSEMFSYPDGSCEILAPMGVHLTQTGGKMAYFQYGKFNFCYRWCVEDAVEYGWRYEYLKHAVRSMILAGEYKLAQRYIDILKQTLFHASWADEMENYVNNPEIISKEGEFSLPLALACYDDALDVDDSLVEAYLIKNFKNMYGDVSPEYLETALAQCLIRKDAKSFWYIFNEYLRAVNPKTLPRHYQEAFLLFYNLDRGKEVSVNKEFFQRFISANTQRRFDSFLKKVGQYKGKKKEDELAPLFKDEYGDTYLYFYFFVRKIRTN
ncbi:MAG: hypothetical protein IKU76_01510 [Bacteroidaceae bacterium]|nr:hypothetical protein [Bacteroidaceae bacterium]